MDNKFSLQQKIGDIVAEFPKASEIFMKYKIDFCCGGDRPLGVAVTEQQLSGEQIIEELNREYAKRLNQSEETSDWRNTSLTVLIEHIVDKHHVYMRETLPILDNLLGKVLNAHYMDHGKTLSKIRQLFFKLRLEIEEHLIKEEKILFPLIKEYDKHPTAGKRQEALEVMREIEDEHTGAGDILKELRVTSNQYELPESACRTFELTYARFIEMEADLFEHIHLENNILFKRLREGE